MTIFRHELYQGRIALIIWSASIAFLFAGMRLSVSGDERGDEAGQ